MAKASTKKLIGGADRVLRQRDEELSILHDLMEETTSLVGIDALLQKMVRLVSRVMNCEIVSVMLLDEETGKLHMQAASGLDRSVVNAAGVEPGQGISGHVALTGKPVLVRDIGSDERFRPAPHADQYTTGSAICAPLKGKGRIVGVLNVSNKIGGGPFEEDDLRLLTTIAGQAALAIENARLYEELREKGRQLEEVVEEKTRELEMRHQEILRLKEFNERVLQNIGSGIMTLNLDGTITSLNRAAEEILGRKAEGVMGHSLSDVVGEENFHGIVSAAMEESGYRKHEMSVRWADGREVPVGFSTFPMRGDEERLEGVILLFRDLTEINELKRMDRLASLGVMSAGIAHEVRNPLTAVKFGLEFLRQEVGESGQEELDIITKNINRMEEILNSLLRFSRPGKTDFKEQDLNRLVHGVLLLLMKQCDDHGVEIDLDLAEDLPPVHADESQVQQVLLNICLNAVQVMEGGGVLRIRTAPRLRKMADGEGLYAQVEIADTGPGVPQEEQDFLFNPFYSTRNEGTGLGLSITYRIVQDHGGFIEVRNRPEGGAVFTTGFPSRQALGVD